MDSALFTAVAILMATTYGIFQVEIKVIELVNGLRDRVLDHADTDNMTVRSQLLHRLKLILWNDWLPMMIANAFFLGIFAVLIWHLPVFVPGAPNVAGFRRAEQLCRWVAALPAFGVVACVIGGAFDLIAMRRAIRDLTTWSCTKQASA